MRIHSNEELIKLIDSKECTTSEKTVCGKTHHYVETKEPIELFTLNSGRLMIDTDGTPKMTGWYGGMKSILRYNKENHKIFYLSRDKEWYVFDPRTSRSFYEQTLYFTCAGENRRYAERYPQEHSEEVKKMFDKNMNYYKRAINDAKRDIKEWTKRMKILEDKSKEYAE